LPDFQKIALVCGELPRVSFKNGRWVESWGGSILQTHTHMPIVILSLKSSLSFQLLYRGRSTAKRKSAVDQGQNTNLQRGNRWSERRGQEIQ
jgi:hypothetical protein